MLNAPRDPRSARDPEVRMSVSDERGHPADSFVQAQTRQIHTEEASGNSAGVVRRERIVSDQGGTLHSERITHDIAGAQRIALARTEQLIWLVFGVIEGLIGLRILLKLIGANPANAFAAFVYAVATIFVGPFVTLTGSPSAGAMVLEVPSIIALLVYALTNWALVRIAIVLWPMFSATTTTSESTFDRYHG
jgi:hypothetical protein